MISVRLDYEMEKRLETRARREGVTKSRLVKMALDQFLKNQEEITSPYDLGKDLFGKFGSKDGELSTTYKKRLGRMIAEKHAH